MKDQPKIKTIKQSLIDEKKGKHIRNKGQKDRENRDITEIIGISIEDYKEYTYPDVNRASIRPSKLDQRNIETSALADKYLDDIEDNETTGCIGGFKLFAKKGRIVCSQTIDDRVELCFQAAIPAIRHMLFPSMRRDEKQ